MRMLRIALAGAALLACATTALAGETGQFLTRLGRDTTAFETWTRTGDRLEVNQVGRAPRVLQRHFVYTYEKGALATLDVTVTPPGTTTPTQTIAAVAEPETLRLKIRNGSAPEQSLAVGFPRGGLVIASSSPWTGYQSAIAKLLATKLDSLSMPLYFLGAGSANRLVVRRLGHDSVVVWNDHDDLFHVAVDRTGHVRSVVPLAGTGQFGVESRVGLDLAAMTATFAAQEKAGAGLGTLSPRDSLKVNAGGATVAVDYSRPAKRGRAIFGALVPYGQVWRTGANAATSFRTDKALDFGGLVVPAGSYTLWSVVTAEGWNLIVNTLTGEWGTEHKPEKDLVTIPLERETLASPVERFTISVEPTADGGVLHLDWDTTRASGAFKVAP